MGKIDEDMWIQIISVPFLGPLGLLGWQAFTWLKFGAIGRLCLSWL